MLGHAAHLGGSAFGVAYCYFNGDVSAHHIRVFMWFSVADVVVVFSPVSIVE